MREQRIEGYWYSKYSPEYPMPIANILSDKEAEEIYNLIRKKEENANKVLYRGWSCSRITGESLGNAEYSTNEWSWPGDFSEHYVLKHKVKPTDDFLKYIGYKK